MSYLFAVGKELFIIKLLWGRPLQKKITLFSSAAGGSSGAFQMPIRPSSVVVVVRPSTFSLKSPISQKLFSNFSSNCTYSFYIMSAITHADLDPIEKLEGAPGAP